MARLLHRMQSTNSKNVRAAFLMMFAMVLLSSNDVFMKLSSEHLSIGQMLFIRGVFAVTVFSFVIGLTGRPVINRAARSKWVVLRALCECAITICFISGLSLLPIATASTLAWTSPMFLAVVAAVVLKENVTIKRWLVVLVGFAGVVLITNPASEEFSPAMLLPLAAAALIAVRDLITRQLDSGLHSLYVTWTTLVAVTIAGFLISFLDWKPVALTQIIWLGASAILLSSAYFFQIRAVRLGELSFVAPFSYTGILVAVFYGFVVWSDLPSTITIIGILLVMSAGLYILSHQVTSPAR